MKSIEDSPLCGPWYVAKGRSARGSSVPPSSLWKPVLKVLPPDSSRRSSLATSPCDLQSAPGRRSGPSPRWRECGGVPRQWWPLGLLCAIARRPWLLCGFWEGSEGRSEANPCASWRVGWLLPCPQILLPRDQSLQQAVCGNLFLLVRIMTPQNLFDPGDRDDHHQWAPQNPSLLIGLACPSSSRSFRGGTL